MTTNHSPAELAWPAPSDQAPHAALLAAGYEHQTLTRPKSGRPYACYTRTTGPITDVVVADEHAATGYRINSDDLIAFDMWTWYGEPHWSHVASFTTLVEHVLAVCTLPIDLDVLNWDSSQAVDCSDELGAPATVHVGTAGGVLTLKAAGTTVTFTVDQFDAFTTACAMVNAEAV